jgi:hypothetical protein
MGGGDGERFGGPVVETAGLAKPPSFGVTRNINELNQS